MTQTITLNVSPRLSENEWAKVMDVYRSMDGWVGDAEWPSWFGSEGDPKYITVSAEPSGLVFEANIDQAIWIGWLTVICARLTLSLGVAVHDAEM